LCHEGQNHEAISEEQGLSTYINDHLPITKGLLGHLAATAAWYNVHDYYSQQSLSIILITHNHYNLQTSKAPLEGQALDTSLFTRPSKNTKTLRIVISAYNSSFS